MKSLFPRPIFTILLFTNTSKSRTFFQISHFSTNFQNQVQFSYPSRRHEEESRNVKVSVWWDFENCAPPAGVNVFKIAQSITAAIRANGIKGPIQITAFGDVMQLSRINQEALSSTGINLAHIPNGGKNSADRSLLVDLMYWVSQNPPPAHLLLISGDRDFAGVLHRLRMNNYNILLASPESAPSVLCSAASIMWQWNALLKGENLTGKHFNQPPDGPYGSWYGHYKAPLDDPFAVRGQPTNLRTEEVSEAVSEQQLRPIPKSIGRHIRNFLNLYPKGVSITALRAELVRSNLNIDRDYYGYKKFSRFLLAMPNVLKLHCGSDGNYLVRRVNPKVPEQSDNSGINAEPETNGEAEFGGTSNCMEDKSEKPLLPQSSEQKVTTSLRKLQGPQRVQEVSTEVNQSPPENVVAKASEGQLQTAEQHGSATEMAFLKRFWKRWFGNKETASGEMISNVNSKTAEKDVELKSHSEQSEGSPSFASGKDTSSKDLSHKHSEDTVQKRSQESNLLNQIKNWCRSWRSSNISDESGFKSHEESKKLELCPGTEELFSRESFWREFGSFLLSSHGSVLVLQSRTRAKMAQNLRQEGPSFLSSLSEDDALLLVDLLISDKKWVDECLSRTFPYKLSQQAIRASMKSNSSNLNGLSSVFRNTKDTSNLQSSQKLDGKRRHQNPPHTGVSRPVIQDSCSGESRNEVLIDCQKLVDDIVKQYPEGFSIKLFRSLFQERYGYLLDVNKLGYTKLSNLLQIMPGIKIESTYILPSIEVPKSPGLKTDDPSDQESGLSGTETNLDSESSSLPGKENDFDSRWEELGPVAKSGPSENIIKLESDGEAKDESSELTHGNYEAPLDRDFSDSDEDTSSSKKPDNEKSKVKDENSSLLQILDSWYGRKDGSENVDGMVESPTDGSKLLDTSLSVDQMEKPPTGRRQKTYSFVTDQPGDTKDKFIDDILGNLKKSGARSIETRV
ncbi:putative 3-hydroxybenzoate 6-hydroxylase 1-like [Capsicum annuum]|nr:putative 3-hydroxybenzoate 6-hydroxylase 1-like [Capsicum annuum]